MEAWPRISCNCRRFVPSFRAATAGVGRPHVGPTCATSSERRMALERRSTLGIRREVTKIGVCRCRRSCETTSFNSLTEDGLGSRPTANRAFTQIYTHVVNKGPMGVVSPLDTLWSPGLSGATGTWRWRPFFPALELPWRSHEKTVIDNNAPGSLTSLKTQPPALLRRDACSQPFAVRLPLIQDCRPGRHLL